MNITLGEYDGAGLRGRDEVGSLRGLYKSGRGGRREFNLNSWESTIIRDKSKESREKDTGSCNNV